MTTPVLTPVRSDYVPAVQCIGCKVTLPYTKDNFTFHQGRLTKKCQQCTAKSSRRSREKILKEKAKKEKRRDRPEHDSSWMTGHCPF